MKNIVLFKKPLFYILLGILLLFICALIMYLPKRLSTNIRINEISEVYLDFYSSSSSEEKYPKKLDSKHLDGFKELVKKAKYERRYFTRYKVASHIRIRIIYNNGKEFKFGSSNLYKRNNYNPVIINNTFDFDTFLSWFDSL